MQIHNIKQGSELWHQFRLEHFGASEAAAMLGLSTKVKRNELLHMKHTGQAKEYSEWVEDNLFANGHEVEALARPRVESKINDELYPVTCSNGLFLSASCDGLTLDHSKAWEHKQWNESLVDSIRNGFLPEEYQPQCQQILMITGAEYLVFTVSDGTDFNFIDLIIYPDQKWFDRIRAGWERFAKDLAEYVPLVHAEKPQASAIMQLPTLSIQIRGEVIASNLPDFKKDAETFIANINTDLKTDDDFANAEATVKYCKDTEDSLETAKKSAIAQTASIDEVMRTIDFIKDQLRTKRLDLDKKVKSEKANIKTKIIDDAYELARDHVGDLASEIKLVKFHLLFDSLCMKRDFIESTKNKRTLESLHNAVDTKLAEVKIQLDATAKDVRKKLSWLEETGNESLFPDIQQIIMKDDEDFQLLVNTRIADQKKKVEEAAAQKIIDDAEAKKLAESKPVQEDYEPEPQKKQVATNPSKTAKSGSTRQEIAIQEATESLASIIDSTPPDVDLSAVIVNAIVEGKIKNLSINY